MPALTLTLTESTVAVLNRLVAETGLTPDEVVAHAVRRWADQRLPPVTAEQFRAILAKSPDVPLVPGDELE